VHPRAQQLIESLGLEPHPEGGWYRQVFRSEERVTRHHDGAERRAITTIYFLLAQGTFSRRHRVQSDEVWHFYEGDPLELMIGEERVTLFRSPRRRRSRARVAKCASSRRLRIRRLHGGAGVRVRGFRDVGVRWQSHRS